MSDDSEPQHAVRVRLIPAPVKRKKVNFATLIKNAALAASVENGEVVLSVCIAQLCRYVWVRTCTVAVQLFVRLHAQCVAYVVRARSAS